MKYLFLRDHNDNLSYIQLICKVKQDIVKVRLPKIGEKTLRVPISIINYVSRTEKSIVLDDAGMDSKFANDCYIKNYKPKSILSIPIIHKSKLVGILYLENNLTTGVFTSERIEVLKLLTAQAATSIENASMYKKSKNKDLCLSKTIIKLGSSISISH